MKPEEYVKTIVYNGHMVNVGLDDAGQQYFLEYTDDQGELTYMGCGAYTTDIWGAFIYLFGPVKTMLLEYRDFCGIISYSSDDEMLHGRIEPVNGLVLFEADKLEEIADAFYEAVDHYLEAL